MISLKDILSEMAENDIHYQNILQAFNRGNAETRDRISRAVSKKPYTLEKDLGDLGYEDITDIEKELKLDNSVSEAKKKNKIKPAYLTKDAAAMKKEINRVKKLDSKDPSAYGKWEADYADKGKTKKYSTKKSVATTAYEKRFGKK